ncbi:GNAT family N-acetyltransferase [Virgibacillus phasianinus]|uniref:GNAT family N-acetyltransferase n=1 Tax=Virgibacillus phasianinus TaxID=2017483 RepID=A0A220TZW9_9BACI|nr:GNAT family N-acetyltransferase [Virgibacillus phasianinus]ASK61398.1 GNAT family N-acetyltransferase [Virgibacillus phasianinus]
MTFKTNTFAGYQVRRATKEEAPAVINMLINAARWLKENGINQWSYLHSGKENHEIESAVSKGTTYVVEDTTGNLVASFNLSPEQNDWDTELWGIHPNQSFYLHRLVVERDQHNKQLGKRLLAWMLESMETGGSIRLDCIGHNTVLNQFYNDSGFTFVGSHDMGGELFSKYEHSLE